MVQTEANMCQQASMRRMRQELERLKRMEPRLAIRVPRPVSPTILMSNMCNI
jgi:hypothetical protein